MSWFVSKLSGSPIFLAMSGGKTNFEWAPLIWVSTARPLWAVSQPALWSHTRYRSYGILVYCWARVSILGPFLHIPYWHLKKFMMRGVVDPSATNAEQPRKILVWYNDTILESYVLYMGGNSRIRKKCRGGTMNSSFYFGHIFELRPGRL